MQDALIWIDLEMTGQQAASVLGLACNCCMADPARCAPEEPPRFWRLITALVTRKRRCQGIAERSARICSRPASCGTDSKASCPSAGLDIDSNVIIEIAVIITDGSLQQRIQVVHQLEMHNTCMLTCRPAHALSPW